MLDAGQAPSSCGATCWQSTSRSIGLSRLPCSAQVSAKQLRDDLLSMLVAGHETTGSVLTWTLYLLAQNPAAMAKVRRGPGVG